MKIKGISKLILVTACILLCGSAVYANDAPPESKDTVINNVSKDISVKETDLSEYDKYTEKVMLRMKDKGYPKADDYKITSIYPLYEIYSYDTPYSLMYDIKCNDGVYYSMQVDCERNVVICSQKSQSLHSIYAEKAADNFENIKFIHDLFGAYYLDVQSGVFYDCETGEVVVPMTQNEIEQQKAEREETRMRDKIRSASENKVMTEKQQQKLKEKAEQKAYKNNANSVNGMSAYPDYKMISDVPYYTQTSTCTCIPNSILNVMAYWDKNGYGALISSLSTARTQIVAAMNASGSTTSNNSIPDAVQIYAESKGYYGNAVNMWFEDGYGFFDLQYEIVHGYPCLAGFYAGGPFGGAHMTVGVGYEIGSDGTEYVYVNDNHGNHEKDYEFSYLDFISGIEILDL